MLANEKMASELLPKNLMYIIKNKYPSQKAFAEQIGIAPSYYYKLEEGNRRPRGRDVPRDRPDKGADA